jgi:hypothetical protein
MNLSEFNYRGNGEGPRGPFKAFTWPLGLPFHNGGSVSPLQHQHFSQVVTDSFQPTVIVVAPQAQIATSHQAIATLQGADDPLHGLAHARKAFIPFLLVPTQGVRTPGPAYDAAEHPFASQRRFPGSLGIGGIGKHRRLIAAHHLLKHIRVREVGPRQRQTPDQAAALVHRDMGLVVKVSVPFAPTGPLRLRIGAGLAPARRAGLGLDQSGVNQGAPPHDQPLGLELLRQHGKQARSQVLFSQLITEPEIPGFIRHRVAEGQTQKTPERQAVADGFSQSGIGQVVPLLQQQGLEHHDRRMAGAPLGGMLQGFHELPEGKPVDLAVDFHQKVAFRHLTHGLQVSKAHLNRLSSQHLRPPTSVFIRRLAGYFNMLNCFLGLI